MKNKLQLIDFFADWCGPCRAFAPILKQLGDDNPELTITKVDVDQNQSHAAQYRITALPTLVLLRNNVEVWRHVGSTTATTIQKAIDQFDNE